MSNSDIIAIIAIILSAIVSVTTTLVSYLVNKTNIQAKRSEIAFGRRLEAFREIAEQTGKIKFQLALINDEADFENAKNDIEKCMISFYEAYRKNLVFLPPSISKNVAQYGNGIGHFISEAYTDENAIACHNKSNGLEKQIIDDMQKFVGYI